MDPISQGTLGAVASQVVPRPEKLRAVAFLGCIAGMAPDLDVFVNSSSDPLLFLEYHRQFTHALLFIPVGAALVALPLHPFVRRTLQFRQTYLACLLGYATHGLLDACTSYGTQLLWPFSDERVAWNNISIVDPLFTVPLLCLVILAAVLRRRALALAGLIWAIGYLLLGAVQHQRAEAAGAQLAAERGHQPHRLSAKAGFANLLVWKVVYEHDGRFYVDGIRAGPAVTVCPGASSNSRWRVSSLRVAGWSRWAGSAVTARASAPLAVSRCVDFAAPSPPEHPARRTPDHRSERDYEVS